MPRYEPPSDPRRRRDALRERVNGKGRYNRTHRKGEPLARFDPSLRQAANRSPAPHGPPNRAPGTAVTRNERMLQKPGAFGPKLIEAIKARLGQNSTTVSPNIPPGVTPTKPQIPLSEQPFNRTPAGPGPNPRAKGRRPRKPRNASTVATSQYPR